MPEVGAALCWKGQISRAIRPKKECIKPRETCCANTLNLNDKGPNMKWACFPKVLWSFSYLTLTQNKPSEFLKVIYLIITAWQWLMSFPYTPCIIPMQIKPIKACQGKGWGALPLREWTFHPSSSRGLDSPCEFVSSQPQRHRHRLLVTASIVDTVFQYLGQSWQMVISKRLVAFGIWNHIGEPFYSIQ